MTKNETQTDDFGTAIYRTTIQCEQCLEHFEAEFDDPNESFSAACPSCGAHYPEVYV